MDMGFGPPVPEPFGGDFLDLAENEIDQQYQGPLGGMLENLENSIEQSLPPAGMPNAPPDTMLDLVERSTERQAIPGTQLPEYLQDPLHDLLDALEKDTENQAIKKEKPDEAPAPEPDEAYGSFSQAFVPHLGEAWFIREHPYPEYRMTGSRTGIRCSSGGMMYCHLRSTWISQDECDSCNAFEPAEDTSGDEGCCRYAF